MNLRNRETGSNLADLGRDAVHADRTNGEATLATVIHAGAGGYEEGLRRTRSDAAGAELGTDPADRHTVNMGTLSYLPYPGRCQRPGGQGHRRLMDAAGGGAAVVVRGRESRPHDHPRSWAGHGEGRQRERNGTLSSTPVGVGPYKVVTATPGQGLTLERTPGYWQPEVQRVATLEVIGIPDSQTRYNALSTGEISAATVAIDQAKSADQAGMTLVAGPTPLIYFLAVNTASEPFDDPKVREAMSLAINREDIAAGLYEGFCDPQVQLFPQDTIGYSEEIGDGLDQWPYDPEKAKQLVEEAGVSASSTFDANVTAGDTVALAEVLQNQLGEVGINMNVKPGPSATLLEDFAFAKTSPLTVSGYTGPPDPAGVIDRNFLPTALYNPGEAVYDEMLAIGQDAASATDPSERNALYGQFTEVFLEEVRNIIPICLLHQIVAAGPDVSGVHAPTDYVDLRNIAVSS